MKLTKLMSVVIPTLYVLALIGNGAAAGKKNTAPKLVTVDGIVEVAAPSDSSQPAVVTIVTSSGSVGRYLVIADSKGTLLADESGERVSITGVVEVRNGVSQLRVKSWVIDEEDSETDYPDDDAIDQQEEIETDR